MLSNELDDDDSGMQQKPITVFFISDGNCNAALALISFFAHLSSIGIS